MPPTVAIVGSAEPGRGYDPPLRDTASAAAAAEELGRELAAQQCRIVVYSGDDEFIESAVVHGYVAAGRAEPGSVQVRGPYDATTAGFAEVPRRPELFHVLPDASSDWEVSFYRSLLAVDAVLLVGGGRSTFIAGLIALSRRVPLAPVAAFGGGAEKAWQRLRSEPGQATEDDLAATAGEWRPGSARAIVTSLVEQHRRHEQERERLRRESALEARRGTRSLLVGLGLLLVALAAVPLSYAWEPASWRALAVLAAAPVLAAMCGAIMRSASDGSGNRLRAAVLGACAGAVAFLLFVAAQLSTNPEVLSGGGAKRLVFFVLAIGFIAGFGFDAVYAKLRGTDVTTTSAVEVATGPVAGR
ncbi:hypothetical protein [Micromonospora sp. WMMD812]|uniref:hypothetical protein n=1 Tax=Micromonospora sp. WMMD812 TaxID=3015152 RepID=UPI00248CF0FC|nr:hypothetical protein [Micromonospora sp. WMMD812]WBB67013.1 hypothetical protein O7603_28495 [Micromonospora sp. WMMD812]